MASRKNSSNSIQKANSKFLPSSSAASAALARVITRSLARFSARYLVINRLRMCVCVCVCVCTHHAADAGTAARGFRNARAIPCTRLASDILHTRSDISVGTADRGIFCKYMYMYTRGVRGNA